MKWHTWLSQAEEALFEVDSFLNNMAQTLENGDLEKTTQQDLAKKIWKFMGVNKKRVTQ